jgi:hypothetical protein
MAAEGTSVPRIVPGERGHVADRCTTRVLGVEAVRVNDLAKVRVAVSNTVVRSTETLPAPSAVGVSSVLHR